MSTSRKDLDNLDTAARLTLFQTSLRAVFVPDFKCSDDIRKFESDYIFSRKTWTDVITATDQVYSDNEDNKQKVIAALISLEYTDNPQQVLEAIIQCLQVKSVLSITFKAKFLKQGLYYHQVGNIFEHATNIDPDDLALREDTEQGLYKHLKDYKPSQKYKLPDKYNSELTQSVSTAFLTNLHARPRYGSFQLPSDKWNLKGIGIGYGNSFIVLRPIAKFNSTFVPRDSFNKFNDQHYKPSTYFNFANFLMQCSPERLKELAERAIRGTPPPLHSDYIEFMGPAFNFLDPNLIELIYINPHEHILTKEELSNLTAMGINVCNAEENPYPQLTRKLFDNIRENNFKWIDENLKKYPSLLYVTNDKGEEPLQLAARLGCRETINILIKYGADPYIKGPGYKTAVELANEAKHYEVFDDYIKAKQNKLAAYQERQQENQAHLEQRNLFFDYVAKNNIDEVRKLLRFNPNLVHITNSDNENAHDIAAKHKHIEIIKLLNEFSSKEMKETPLSSHSVFAAEKKTSLLESKEVIKLEELKKIFHHVMDEHKNTLSIESPRYKAIVKIESLFDKMKATPDLDVILGLMIIQHNEYQTDHTKQLDTRHPKSGYARRLNLVLNRFNPDIFKIEPGLIDTSSAKQLIDRYNDYVKSASSKSSP